MLRLILASLFLTGCTSGFVFAQRGGHAASMRGGSASHAPHTSPVHAATTSNGYSNAGYIGGGFLGGYYSSGGFYSGAYGYGGSLYDWTGGQQFVIVPQPIFVFPPPAIENRPATLALVFPAPAKISLDGKDVPGEPVTEKVLTSEPLPFGDWHFFKVSARWEVGGQTYVYSREVSVAAGSKSRVIVLSGIAVQLEK